MDIAEVAPGADARVAEALFELQRVAYAVEARLVQDERIPPLHEDVAALRSAGLFWLVARIGPVVVGAIAWTQQGATFDIDRLVVLSRAHRRGVGSALVREMLRRAGGHHVTVSTGRANAPARLLYERLGFVLVGEEEIVPGLWITRYDHLPLPEPAEGATLPPL